MSLVSVALLCPTVKLYDFLHKDLPYLFCFYFEIMVGSHAVIRNNTKRSHQFPPVVTSWVTVIQCHNQETDIVYRVIGLCLGSREFSFLSWKVSFFLFLCYCTDASHAVLNRSGNGLSVLWGNLYQVKGLPFSSYFAKGTFCFLNQNVKMYLILFLYLLIWSWLFSSNQLLYTDRFFKFVMRIHKFLWEKLQSIMPSFLTSDSY